MKPQRVQMKGRRIAGLIIAMRAKNPTSGRLRIKSTTGQSAK
jgi:hypothetical protein